jgi:NTP pyrophosphatase (non-canonical NTP hydrolase)
MDLKKINQKIKNFVKEREWDKFHSPKNLSMALSVEASELVEIFQWLKESDFKKVDKQKVADEIADILFYLLRISQKMNINIEKSFYAKLKKNVIKYPVSLSKGSSRKRR